MLLSFLIITFTPVKYYLPGFGEAGVRKQLRELMVETEKLKAKQRENDLWTENIRQVLSGEIPSDKIHFQEATPTDTSKK
jgi:hypothetical protein